MVNLKPVTILPSFSPLGSHSNTIQKILRRFPIRIFAIEGTSMYPRLKPGDLVLVHTTKSVRLNNILVFRDPAARIIAHRVVSKEVEGYQTKGDNSPFPDPHLLREDNIIGKLIFRLPWLGKPRNYFKKFTRGINE